MPELVTSLHDNMCEKRSLVCLIYYRALHWFVIRRFTEVLEHSSCVYRASMTIKTLYYPTDAQIYNS